MSAIDRPGPWHVDPQRDEEYGTAVVDARGKVVVFVLRDRMLEERYDAGLIAAAPTLLEEHAEMLTLLREEFGDDMPDMCAGRHDCWHCRRKALLTRINGG